MSGGITEVDLGTVRSWLKGGFHDVLQMSLVDYDPQDRRLTLSLPYREAYARLPAVGDYHGGVLSAFLDVAGTFTAALAAGSLVTTVSLRTDYLRSPVRVDLTATGTVIRAGRNLITCDVAISDADERGYAVARGTWAVLARTGAPEPSGDRSPPTETTTPQG